MDVTEHNEKVVADHIARNRETVDFLHQKNLELAEHLELCAELLQGHVRSLRGEERDQTGLGLWEIFCNNLEQAANIKIISKHHWESLIKSSGGTV